MDVEEAGPCGSRSDSCEQPSVHSSSDEDSPGLVKHLDDVEWIEELNSEDEDEGGCEFDPSVGANSRQKNTSAETARMFKLRRSLRQLASFRMQKEHEVLTAREQLKRCHQNTRSLTEQRNELEKEIDQHKPAERSVAVFRLQDQHKHLCQRLHDEEELKSRINAGLMQQELELNKVELELGRLSLFQQELREEEEAYKLRKAQKAMMRLQQQKKASQNMQWKRKHKMNEQAALQMKVEAEHQRRAEASRVSHTISDKYLKETIKRINQQKAVEEQQNMELLKRRTQAVESLKANIAANKKSLNEQRKQRQQRIDAQKNEQQQKQQRKSWQAQGINSIKLMHQQKQQEIKQKLNEFEVRREFKNTENVPKLQQEDRQVKSKETHKIKWPSTQASLESLSKSTESCSSYQDPSLTSISEEIYTEKEFTGTSSSSSGSDAEGLEYTVFQQEDQQCLTGSLSETELSGLWDWDSKKFWTEEASMVLIKQNQGKPTDTERKLPVKADGRELKRPLFVSRPPLIHFKDFDVGKTYKKKLILTNSSSVTDHCKFLRVSSQLQDFISINACMTGPGFFIPLISASLSADPAMLEQGQLKPVLYYYAFVQNHLSEHITFYSSGLNIHEGWRVKLLGAALGLVETCCLFHPRFKPAGRLAAGMSCEMQAVFQPKFNKDLEGDVQFSAEAGMFSVPIRCTIKKCEVEVDSQFIDFGTHVVGQTTSRTFTLTNKGALAAFFTLDASETLSEAKCQAQLTSQAVSPDNQTSSVSTDLGAFQVNQQNEDLFKALLQRQSDDPATLPEDIPEGCASTREVIQMDQSQSDSSDLSLGKVREGEIGPFESTKLKVVFTPTVPGEARLKFDIKFSDSTIKPIPIRVTGVAVNIPVWVINPNIDLRICVFDHLYQDVITVQSKASTALKVTFEVCPELRKHMKILPKSGFIQAQSSFSAQVRFLPRGCLSKDASEFFDADTGVLEAPVAVQIAGQVKPLQIVLHAIVTTSELQFELSEVDFGCCSIYSSVKKTVGLTNLSLLPQEFGFVGVPEYIDVQPNDGFGTLLPQETLEFDLIFSPTMDNDYSFQINCKSEFNRDYLLSCRGSGVQPPLELSHSLVRFGDTALSDCSSTVVFLTNHEVMKDRLFSFALPSDCDISISPAAGRLQPGERSLILVTFRPTLSDQAIREEAQRLLQTDQGLEPKLEQSKKETMVRRKGKRASVTSNESAISSIPQADQQAELNPADTHPGSWLYEQARTTLLCDFPRRYNDYIVPCFVSDGISSEEDIQEQPPWSPVNTLYLELQCAAVRPALVVTSNNGRNIVDFDRVILGEKMIKRITVQNICKDSLDLKNKKLRSSLLDLNGSFSLLNALRCLKPGQKHTLILAFRPSQEKKYCERLEVHTQKMTLEVLLRGSGVVPAVTCSHPSGILDFGYVLEKESTSQVLKLQNSSVVTVGFRVHLASLCPSLSEDEAETVAGTQNYSGLSVFGVVPVEGSIAPEQSVDITITFQPDHSSVNYRDRLSVKLMNQTDVCVLDLRGAASSNHLYLLGGDPLRAPSESLLPPLISSQSQLTETAVMEETPVPVLVTLRATCSAGVLTPAVRQLQVGCIGSSQLSKKEGGEFLCEDVAILQELGFSLQPSKGTIEAGQKRTISISWTPNREYKSFEVVQTCVSISLKGAQRSVYRVTLMALVSNTAD